MVGSLTPFDSRRQTWEEYCDVLDHFFAANEITDGAKKRAIMLFSVGSQTCSIMRNLLSPDKPGDETYVELTELLQSHCNPKPSEIVQRFKFNSRTRAATESVAEYVAVLRELAQHCNYGDKVNEMLRDRLVCGIADDRIQRRLLAEPELTFEKALKISQAIETTNRDVRHLQEEIHTLDSAGSKNTSQLAVHAELHLCTPLSSSMTQAGVCLRQDTETTLPEHTEQPRIRQKEEELSGLESVHMAESETECAAPGLNTLEPECVTAHSGVSDVHHTHTSLIETETDLGSTHSGDLKMEGLDSTELGYVTHLHPDQIKTETDGGYLKSEQISDWQDTQCVDMKSDQVKCESGMTLVSDLMNTVKTEAGGDLEEATEPWQCAGEPNSSCKPEETSDLLTHSGDFKHPFQNNQPRIVLERVNGRNKPVLRRRRNGKTVQKLTDGHLEQMPPMESDGSKASVTCVGISGDEYSRSKSSAHGNCSEGSDELMSNGPPVKRLKKQTSQSASGAVMLPSATTERDKGRSGSEISDATNLGNVSVLKVRKMENGARVNNKKNYCLYCSVQFYKMARHLRSKHSREPAVAKACTFPVNSRERKLHFDLIRNQGNRAHNNEVLQAGSGTLIPRQQALESMKASDYMHCMNCEALLKRKSLRKHMSRCRLAQKCGATKPDKDQIRLLFAFARPVPDGVSSKVWELVDAMHQDEVTRIIREEKSILRLGAHFYAKHGHKKTKHEYIRGKMREMGRLIQHSKKAWQLKRIEDFYIPSNFSFVVEAVKDLAGFDEDKKVFRNPSLALKLGHSLKKIADILEYDAQMAESHNEQFLENLARSRSLYQKEWDISVSSCALQTLKQRQSDTSHVPNTASSTPKRRPDTIEPDGGDFTKETSKRRSWSVSEVRAVEKTLIAFIESGKVPGKSDCVACITASPEALQNRSWTAVKFYVKNRITAIQRENAERMY